MRALSRESRICVGPPARFEHLSWTFSATVPQRKDSVLQHIIIQKNRPDKSSEIELIEEQVQ